MEATRRAGPAKRPHGLAAPAVRAKVVDGDWGLTARCQVLLGVLDRAWYRIEAWVGEGETDNLGLGSVGSMSREGFGFGGRVKGRRHFPRYIPA